MKRNRWLVSKAISEKIRKFRPFCVAAAVGSLGFLFLMEEFELFPPVYEC